MLSRHRCIAPYIKRCTRTVFTQFLSCICQLTVGRHRKNAIINHGSRNQVYPSNYLGCISYLLYTSISFIKQSCILCLYSFLLFFLSNSSLSMANLLNVKVGNYFLLSTPPQEKLLPKSLKETRYFKIMNCQFKFLLNKPANHRIMWLWCYACLLNFTTLWFIF